MSPRNIPRPWFKTVTEALTLLVGHIEAEPLVRRAELYQALLGQLTNVTDAARERRDEAFLSVADAMDSEARKHLDHLEGHPAYESEVDRWKAERLKSRVGIDADRPLSYKEVVAAFTRARRARAKAALAELRAQWMAENVGNTAKVCFSCWRGDHAGCIGGPSLCSCAANDHLPELTPIA